MPLFDIALAVEDQFHRDSVPVLKRQGWRPRVIPYDGYGTSTPAQSEPSNLPGPTSERHRRPVRARTEVLCQPANKCSKCASRNRIRARAAPTD